MAEGPTALATAPSSDSESEPMLKPRSQNSPEQPGEEQREMIELYPVPAPEQAPQPPLSSGPGSQPTPGSSIQQGETPQEYPTPLATATTTATPPSSDSESESSSSIHHEQEANATDTDDDDHGALSLFEHYRRACRRRDSDTTEKYPTPLATATTTATSPGSDSEREPTPGSSNQQGERAQDTEDDDREMTWEQFFESQKGCLISLYTGNIFFVSDLVENMSIRAAPWPKAWDDLRMKVERNADNEIIIQEQAGLNIFIDGLVEIKGDLNEALLLVTMMEEKDIFLENRIEDNKYAVHIRLPYLIETLIKRGADSLALGDDNNTPLYRAVYRHLAYKNFQEEINAMMANLQIWTPDHKYFQCLHDDRCRLQLYSLVLALCLDKEDDDMCAHLLTYTPRIVHQLHRFDKCKSFSLLTILHSGKSMQKTILQMLDCMIEPFVLGISTVFEVRHESLEIDANRRTPDAQVGFDYSSKTAFHIIAEQGNEDIVCHDVVRLLVERKWKLFAKRRFVYEFLFYLFALTCITVSACWGALTEDATEYNSRLQIARAVFEVISWISVFMTLCNELFQLKRHGIKEYIKDRNNWFDLSSSLLLLSVPGWRFTSINAQWYVFACGYLSWTIRIFKFASLTSQIGVYVQIFERLLQRDLLKFGALFLVILLAFSVSLTLTLKGDGEMDKHNETSTPWGILIVGIRSLTEASAVVEYSGQDGYAGASSFIMGTYVFTCIIILINIFIAQLSDAYQKKEEAAQRGQVVARAKFVARMELDGLFGMKGFRRTFYRGYDIVKSADEVKRLLQSSKTPSLNEMNQSIRDMGESFRDRMTKHETTLMNIRTQLEEHMNKLQTQIEQIANKLNRNDDTTDAAKDALRNENIRYRRRLSC